MKYINKISSKKTAQVLETPSFLAPNTSIFKQTVDCAGAVALTILCAPVLLVIAALVKLDSHGPVFFRQYRHGLNNEIFRVYKFRTMTVPGTNNKFRQAHEDEARITRIGHFLRKTSLDELPQLINVLKGEMSLVGPRPHAVEHNEEYLGVIENYFARHCVKPGITGLAQVNGSRGPTPNVNDMRERLHFDLTYIQNWSVWLDLKILFKTFTVLFTK